MLSLWDGDLHPSDMLFYIISHHFIAVSFLNSTTTLHQRQLKSIQPFMLSWLWSEHMHSFRALCTGEKGLSAVSERPLYYKNSIIHRSIRDFMLQGGGVSLHCLTLRSQFIVSRFHEAKWHWGRINIRQCFPGRRYDTSVGLIRVGSPLNSSLACTEAAQPPLYG